LVSVLAFLGTTDSYLPYRNDGAPDIPTWAHHDGISHGPTQFAKGKFFTAIRYSSCSSGTEVQLYTVIAEGDQWPASFDLTNKNDDADELIWQFFAAHPRH
jgi:poly(3-hydroxybutyrate) depolymerase